MTTSATKQIATVLVRTTIRDIAWPMSRARQNGVLSPYDFVARFWERVGATGEALEAAVERVTVRLGIDIWDVLEPMFGVGEA